MASTTQHSKRLRFATQLREALDEKNVSIRSISRELNPLSPETARSNISRWLRASHMPSRTSRRRLAVALGFPADHFESDDDDEESGDVAAVLLATIRTLVRSEMEKRDRVVGEMAGAAS